MLVTLVAEDNLVIVNGYPETVDLSSLDEEIHAVQWYGTVGEIEYKTDYVNGTRKGNQRITNFTPFQHYVDLWEVEAKKEAPVVDIQAQIDALNAQLKARNAS